MFRCKNSTIKNPTNIICKSDDVINQKLKGGFFEFYYTDRYIDMVDFNDPIKEYMMVYFTTLDPFTSRFVDFFLKKVNITSDSGLVFEEKLTKSTVMFDYFREQFDTKSAETTIIQFYVNSGNNFLDINRTYFKLTDLLAIIGGIFNVCIIIGEKLSKVISEVQVKIKILNTLFFFDTEHQDDIELTTLSKDDDGTLVTSSIKKKSLIEIKRDEFLVNELKSDIKRTMYDGKNTGISSLGKEYKKTNTGNNIIQITI